MSVYANIITVTNTEDSGSGSLRQALADANDGDTINFDPALNGQAITITTAELVIAKSIIISGPKDRLPRKDHRGVDLICDALPFRRLCVASRTPSRMPSATQSFAADPTMP